MTDEKSLREPNDFLTMLEPLEPRYLGSFAKDLTPGKPLDGQDHSHHLSSSFSELPPLSSTGDICLGYNFTVRIYQGHNQEEVGEKIMFPDTHI